MEIYIYDDSNTHIEYSFLLCHDHTPSWVASIRVLCVFEVTRRFSQQRRGRLTVEHQHASSLAPLFFYPDLIRTPGNTQNKKQKSSSESYLHLEINLVHITSYQYTILCRDGSVGLLNYMGYNLSHQTTSLPPSTRAKPPVPRGGATTKKTIKNT